MIRYVVIALLFACGASAQEIKSAKDARYNGNIADMLDIALESTRQAGYTVDDRRVDDIHSAFLTEPRWYQYGGQPESHLRGNEYRIHTDSVLVGFLVRLEHVEDAREMTRVTVSPVVRSNISGPLEPANPKIPSWVNDKANEIWIAVHKSLAKFEIRGP